MTFTREHGIWQNAWVVPDVEEAAMHWVRDFGVGPFFVARYGNDLLTDLVYRGRPGTLNILVAVSYAGPLQIELIQRLDDHPTPYGDTVAPERTAFHHVAVWSDDIERDLAHYRDQGHAIALTGRVIDFVRFAYVDTHSRYGCMLELVERHPAFDARLRTLEGICRTWDGRDPLRAFPVLGQAIGSQP